MKVKELMTILKGLKPEEMEREIHVAIHLVDKGGDTTFEKTCKIKNITIQRDLSSEDSYYSMNLGAAI